MVVRFLKGFCFLFRFLHRPFKGSPKRDKLKKVLDGKFFFPTKNLLSLYYLWIVR